MPELKFSSGALHSSGFDHTLNGKSMGGAAIRLKTVADRNGRIVLRNSIISGPHTTRNMRLRRNMKFRRKHEVQAFHMTFCRVDLSVTNLNT